MAILLSVFSNQSILIVSWEHSFKRQIMRKVLFLLSVIIFTASCQDKTVYTLKGRVEGIANDTKIYLCEDLYRTVIIDSTTIKDGQFAFNEKLEKPVVRTLKVSGSSIKQKDVNNIASVSSLVVMEPEKTTEVTINAKGFIVEHKGSPLMEKNIDFWAGLGQSEAPDSELLINMIKENKDNALGMFYFANITALINSNSEKLKELYPLFSDKRGQDEKVDTMLEYIVRMSDYKETECNKEEY